MSAAGMNWEGELQQAGTLAQDIVYLIGDRDAAVRSGKGGSDLSARARNSLAALDKALDKLDKELKEMEQDPRRFRLNQREVTSRRETLKKLQQERLRLRTAERSNAAAAAHAADRESLLSAGDGKSYGRETELTRDMTTQQLVERGNEEIKAQDSILDNMSKRLDNLKNMGKAIGDESDLHMTLLDNLEKGVDKANVNLDKETERARRITEETKTCWLYVTICILLLVLVALAAVRWA